MDHENINPEEDKKITIVIIDDDLPSVELLRNALIRYQDVRIVGIANDLKSGRKLISESAPDLVFLDIELPTASGLDIFDKGDTYPGTRFVFYTLYQKYFHDAFRLRAYDYLLKPFDPDEVGIILERFRIEDRLPGLSAPEVMKHMEPHSGNRLLSITTLTNERVILPSSSILFFKYDSERKIWEVITNRLERHILKRHTTAELILSFGDAFVRTHKSYIVNLSYLALISGNEIRLLPPFNEISEIKVSKNYKRKLLDRFYDL